MAPVSFSMAPPLLRIINIKNKTYMFDKKQKQNPPAPLGPPGWWRVVVSMLHQVAEANVKSTVYTMLAVRKEVMVSDCCNLLNSCRTRDGGARGINLLPPPDLVVSAPWAASDYVKCLVSCLRGQNKTSKIRGFAPWRLQQPANILGLAPRCPKMAPRCPRMAT